MTLVHECEELQRIYARRFDDHIVYRNKVWKVLTSQFFSRYVNPEAAVLDLGCGYGEFINNIACARKWAMDLNPAAKGFVSKDVHFLAQDCSSKWELRADSLDVVFTSNFFEHLPSKAALANTIAQVKRCLRPGGRLIAVGPNARYIGGAYWDFWDHHLALTDRSLKELVELQGLQPERVTARFLPYTMVNARRSPMLLVQAYLHLPAAWRFFGKQFLVIARNPG